MIRLFLALLLFFFLPSCAKTPSVKRYFFSTPKSVPYSDSHKKTSKVLLVTRPVASSGYQTKSMLYVSCPYQLAQFARHAWMAPPADMLFPLIVQGLRSTNAFYGVVSAPYVGLSDLRLETKLINLHQVFEGKESYVLLEVQAALINAKTNRLLRSRHFLIREKAPENTPYGGVVAANRAVDQLIWEISKFAVKGEKLYKSHTFLPKPKL